MSGARGSAAGMPLVGERQVLHVRLLLPDGHREALYAEVLESLANITPVVQAIPPDGADLDVTGALRFWGLDLRGIAYLVQVRLVALFGLDRACVGAGTNRQLAAMAASVTPPGRVTVVGASREAVASFLRPLPVAALPGVGPATVESLRRYGLHTVGSLADLPLATLQRILGGTAGRAVRDRALGIDPRPVTPAQLPRSLTRAVDFPADVLDPERHRAALLSLADALGGQLRREEQVAGAMVLTVGYADRSTSVRKRVLPESTAHSAALARTAYALYEQLGLQRARVRRVQLRLEALRPDGEAVRQLSFDPEDDRARAVEAAADRARARFGSDAVIPASLASSAGRGHRRRGSAP
ncbi:DNA polymerase thumb domain-containing protein [Streptomyces sp. NPDC020917]|uniref:DNA polymerase Y family protein n=1 Tax=Streptomyces sp. NPDC020917 TaxID=3365102 RepID=UPI0037A3EF27